MKEISVSILIIICILIGNGMTENYTKYATEEASKQLATLKEEMLSNRDKKELKNIVNEIHENWDEKYEKLAYYVEHNELEKVESGLTIIRSYIETEEYSQSIAEVDETIYILRHIEEKYRFNLKNIF